MKCAIIRPVLYPLAILLSLITVSFGTVASNRFDISYLWHHDVASALEYREQIARVLGPDVSKDLKVVDKANLYGVIYHRGGDNAGATRVARSHTRLLRSHDLEAAVPVRSLEWTFLEDEQNWPASSGATTKSKVIRDKTRRTARHHGIHDLETAVENYIKRLRQEGRIASDERTGWSVYDFTTGEKLVTINENLQFQSASLVKPFIAAAFFQKVEQGKLVYGNKSQQHMERMIQHSNNRSTNWITRHVGGPQAVERILKRHSPRIFQKTRIVEYIPKSGRTYRNKASIHDYSRFLYALWTNKIPGAREIKRLMSLPGSDRIYTGVRKVPKDTKVYNKTGSTARVCADMGILIVKDQDGHRYPYTLIGIIEKQQRAQNYPAWIRSRSNVIRDVSNIVYKGIAQHHNFSGMLQPVAIGPDA